MKQLIIIAALFTVASPLYAQIEYSIVDTVVFRQVAAVDSSLVGKNVFDRSMVNVIQSEDVRSGMERHISDNASRKLSGYRVRIFFDNKQNSRNASDEALKVFLRKYPGHAAYRSFSNPFFKVTVGDFRTKSEAMQLMNQVIRDFPAAFIVKETINYPVVDREHSYVADTLHIIRENE